MNLKQSLVRSRRQIVAKEKQEKWNAEKYSAFLNKLNITIVDRQGNKISDEERLKHRHLTVDVNIPEIPKEKPKEEEKEEDLETTLKRVPKKKRNQTPEKLGKGENTVKEEDLKIKKTKHKRLDSH